MQQRRQKKSTQPTKAMGALHKSNSILPYGATWGEIAVAGFGLFCLLVLPRLMYPIIAASKGWI